MGGKSQYTFRLDAIKFCHKVFAITDCAFGLCETVEKPGWLVWLDADTVAVRPLSRYNLLQSLPKGSDLVHLGRKNFTYSETSFIGLNLESQPPIDFLGDFLGAYLSGELLHYREWHDGFIFERLLTIYKAHGLKFHDWTGDLDIKSMTEGKQAFELFPLGDYVKHKKGKKKDKTIHFGLKNPKKGTYIDHKDKEIRKNYRARHEPPEKKFYNDPTRPATLSRFILWGDATNLTDAIKDYKKKFKLT